MHNGASDSRTAGRRPVARVEGGLLKSLEDLVMGAKAVNELNARPSAQKELGRSVRQTRVHAAHI